MEGFVVPLAAAVLLFPIAFMALPPALSSWRRRHERKRAGFSPPKGPVEKLRIPPADETAAAVERFHEAVRRSDLADYLRPD